MAKTPDTIESTTGKVDPKFEFVGGVAATIHCTYNLIVRTILLRAVSFGDEALPRRGTTIHNGSIIALQSQFG
jgi:hypothetical protein